MLRAEFDAPELVGPCCCCGERDTVLTAEVYDDDDGEPYAMLHAVFCRPSRQETASLRVTLTEWSGAAPVPRETFAVRVRCDADKFFFSFVDNADGDMPADGDGPAVHCLSRAEALAHARKTEVLDVVDCAMAAGVLQRYLDRPGMQ